MNWTEEDLGKPQVLVDSAYGMGHPGTFHFQEIVEEVSNGVYEAGAGLDDIEEDPAKQRHWIPVNPLFTLPNVVITPHAAYYSEEAIHTVRDFAAHETVRVLTGQAPLSPVNADQIASPGRPDRTA
jgi:phosphoglycerate dehydrogenase-like enzyme